MEERVAGWGVFKPASSFKPVHKGTALGQMDQIHGKVSLLPRLSGCLLTWCVQD